MIKKILAMIICFSFLLTGCENILNKRPLPQDIVGDAIDTNENMKDYYIESSVEIYNKDVLISKEITQEWKVEIDGEIKRRVETYSKQQGRAITIFANNKLSVYNEKSNEVYLFGDAEDWTPEADKGLKGRTKVQLETLNTIFDLETLPDEKLEGRDTYHIKGSHKEKLSSLGDYETWIDKETLGVVKVISINEDMKTITKNIKIDLYPKVDSSTFKLDAPEDANRIRLYDEIGVEDLTMYEAYQQLDNNLLTIKDESYKLDRLELHNSSDSVDLPEQFIFHYIKDEERIFTISVTRISDISSGGSNAIGYKDREIRGKTASVKYDVIKMIEFEEDGNNYLLMIEIDKMTIEEAIEIVENMEQYKQK